VAGEEHVVTPRTVARVGGVDIRVDRSWVFIAVLATWSFWARFQDERGAAVALVMAIVAAVLFFGSILAHELAHALEARHRGIEVRSITLYLFGGATETASEARRPGDEFAVTAVGPWTSLVLGCAFALLASGADEVGLTAPGQVAALLAWVNLVLAFFNVLPGAPLDGGRMLDSLVWRVTGDHRRARRVATGAGRVLGSALVALGLFEVVAVSGGVVDGLWLALVGWFLVQAAAAEGRTTRPAPRADEGQAAT
jgi:Zn-dependent protease